MKIFLWGLGILVVLALIPIIIIFGNLAFISQITQSKVKRSPDYIALDERLSISEHIQKRPEFSKQRYPFDHAMNDQIRLLHKDGRIENGRRVYDSDPRREVIILPNEKSQQSLVFVKNEVYKYGNERLGNLLGTFPSPGFSYIDFVLEVNDQYMIINGAMEDSPYPYERVLWQVKYDGLAKIKLTDKPYYVGSRPPQVFDFDNEQILVYYIDSFDFAYGGDSSRPKFSVLRLYNSEFPEGHDLIKIGFKAGTVLDIQKHNDIYRVITDPSLPAMADKPRVPVRHWNIVINK